MNSQINMLLNNKMQIYIRQLNNRNLFKIKLIDKLYLNLVKRFPKIKKQLKEQAIVRG